MSAEQKKSRSVTRYAPTRTQWANNWFPL